MPEDERRRPGRGFSDPLARPAPHLRRRPRLNVMRSHRRLDDMGKLDGKIALVTGGNSGIGLATAKEFVNEGAYVFITGRRDPELARAVKEIGRNLTGVQGDVSNLGDLDRLFAQIKQEKGKLDIVFANAGGAKFARIGEITEEHYDALFNNNVKGLLFTVQKALRLMPDGASIILNASIAASTAPLRSRVFITPQKPLRVRSHGHGQRT